MPARNTAVCGIYPTRDSAAAAVAAFESAMAGGGTGALIALGIPEYQAKRYEGRMR